MKLKRPSIKLFIITALFFIFVTPLSVSASTSVESTPIQFQITASEISLKSAITGWRYTTIDGNLYKRLFNYSTQKWEGDWILC